LRSRLVNVAEFREFIPALLL